MQRKVVIAVDGSVESLMACRYIGRAMATDPEFEADLMHIIPAPPPILVQESRTSGEALIRLKKASTKTGTGPRPFSAGPRKSWFGPAWPNGISIGRRRKRLAIPR